jgi:hypothetical protein
VIFKNFDVVFSGIVAELSALLGTPLRPKSNAAQSAIGRSLAAIVRFHAAGELNHRDWNLLRLGLLEKQLRVVAERRPELLPGYRQRLLSQDPEHYMGARFEVLLAANLTYTEIPFASPEPPDFVVFPDDQKLPLECTSIIYRGGDSAKLRVKIRKALNKKVRESQFYIADYGGVGRLTVSADVTNLFHGSDMRGRIFQPADLESYVAARLSELGLGAAVLFTLVLDRERDSLEAVYLRIDGPSVAPEVKAFLDQSFPINRARTYIDYLFPPTT